jgi:hypothetical protein
MPHSFKRSSYKGPALRKKEIEEMNPKMETFKCGCQIWKEANTFYIRPCSANCETLKIAIEASQKRGNRIEVRRE